MSEQLAFDLPFRTALGREDFFISPANAPAVATIDGWQDWPLRKLVLSGPEGAGKTHLAHVWAAQCGARIVQAKDVVEAEIPELAQSPTLAVEDVPNIAGTPGETTLFHLHNMVLEAGGTLLFTGRDAPSRWRLALPDLASRMAGTALVKIDAPDDALFAQLLAKLFADRQQVPNPKVIQYLTGHIDRSFATAQKAVAALDAAALREQRKISVPLATQVLDRLAADN